MIFDFRLKVFYTVATKLSFTKAAAELFITQPAVTKHIHELENQTGQRLFKRQGNSISLTAAGELLLKYSEKIFDMYSCLEADMAQLNDKVGGTLRIGASTTVAHNILPRLLAKFKKAYPQINFSFIEGNTDYITHKVIDERLDIALVEGSSHFSQVAYSNFIQDEILLVARSNSKLAKQGEISPKQLLQIPLVLRETGSGTLDVIYKALMSVNINPKDLIVETHFENTASIKQYLQYSECAAFLSVQTFSNELKYNELSIIDIKGLEIFRTFEFIQQQGEHSPLIELFKKFCQSHYNLK